LPRDIMSCYPGRLAPTRWGFRCHSPLIFVKTRAGPLPCDQCRGPPFQQTESPQRFKARRTPPRFGRRNTAVFQMSPPAKGGKRKEAKGGSQKRRRKRRKRRRKRKRKQAGKGEGRERKERRGEETKRGEKRRGKGLFFFVF